MDERRWERWGAEAGIATVVFAVIAIAVAGESPSQNASGQELMSYIDDNRDGLRMSTLFWALSTVSGLFFLGALRSRLSGAEGNHHELATAAVMGGVYTFLAGMVGGMLMAMSSWREGIDLSPGTVQAMWDGANIAQIMGNCGIAVMAGSIAAVVLATGVLPKWCGYFAAFVGVVCVVSLFGVLMETGALAPLGAFQMFTGAMTFLLILVVSVELLRHAEAPARAGMAATTA